MLIDKGETYMSNYNYSIEDSLKSLESLFGFETKKEGIYPIGNPISRSLMKTDIFDKGNKYLLNIEVPSFEKKDIKLSLKDGYLIVSAERKTEIKKDEVLYAERFLGAVERQFYVGDKIKKEDISAKMENGLLEILISKPKPSKTEIDSISIS